MVRGFIEPKVVRMGDSTSNRNWFISLSLEVSLHRYLPGPSCDKMERILDLESGDMDWNPTCACQVLALSPWVSRLTSWGTSFLIYKRGYYLDQQTIPVYNVKTINSILNPEPMLTELDSEEGKTGQSQQWLSNWGACWNTAAGPQPQFLILQVWGMTCWEFAFMTKCQAVSVLLVLGLHFYKHWLEERLSMREH